MTSWGAVACGFSTLCVCATAIIITQMDPEPQPERGGRPGPQTAAPAAPAPRRRHRYRSRRPRPCRPPVPQPSTMPPRRQKVEGNLVRNGGFETLGGEGASLFEGWGYWGRWENGNYTLESAPRAHGEVCRTDELRDTRAVGGLSQKLERLQARRQAPGAARR